MDIERHDGTKERREYDTVRGMMEDAEKEAANPQTKKLTLRFPKMRIPRKRATGMIRADLLAVIEDYSALKRQVRRLSRVIDETGRKDTERIQAAARRIP